MHNKFIIFGDEDVMTGSFNITFDRWWAMVTREEFQIRSELW